MTKQEISRINTHKKYFKKIKQTKQNNWMLDIMPNTNLQEFYCI